MGNRAVITKLGEQKGIYLHWNGGYSSVNPIVWFAYNFIKDKSELEAVAFVAKCFGLTPTIDDVTKLDVNNMDNGVYIINGGKIIGRAYQCGPEQMDYDFDEFVYSLNASMPANYRQSKTYLLKYLASTKVSENYIDYTNSTDFKQKVKIGSTIWYNGQFHTLLGLSKENKVVSGMDTFGHYYFNMTENYTKQQLKWGLKKYDDIKDIEQIKSNPNSYTPWTFLNYDKGDDSYTEKDYIDVDIRVVDNAKYAELVEKSKKWDAELYEEMSDC